MDNPTWGALLKSQVDNETIEQAIARLIEGHNNDAEAHIAELQSLFDHKNSEIIDHLAESIVTDKLAAEAVTSDKITSNQIVGKDIRTAADVGSTVDGVKMTSAGIEMWESAIKKVNIPVTGDPFFAGNVEVGFLTYSKFVLQSFFESISGWFQDFGGGEVIAHIGGAEFNTSSSANDYVNLAMQPAGGSATDFSKNPLFQTKVKLDYTTSQSIWLTVGEGASSSAKYLGFKISNGTLYAVNRNGSAETSTSISGITLTNANTYKAVMTSASKIEFYVNGVLKATHTTNLPTGTSSYIVYYYIMPTTNNARNMYAQNALFVQDN